MRYFWLDLVLYILAIILLVPLVMRLIEAVNSIVDSTQ